MCPRVHIRVQAIVAAARRRRAGGAFQVAFHADKSRAGSVSYSYRRKTEVASVFQLGISIQRRLGWALLLRQRAPGGPADRERWWGSARKAGALRDEPAAAHSAAQGSHSQPWSASPPY